MRRRISPLAILIALLLTCIALPFTSTLAPKHARAAAAIANDTQSLRILFIGNSLTDYNAQTDGTYNRNNLPLVFQQLAQAGNYTVEVHDNIMLGQSLQDQWDAGDADNLIKNGGPWDYVVLQDSSTLPVDDPQTFYSDVRLFIPDIRNAGAQPLLFENWPLVGTPPDTINTLTNSYQTISQEQNVPVIPFGQAWSNALQTYSTSDLFDDDRHPVYAGTYLNACTLYGFLFQQNPVGLSSLDLNQFTSIDANDLQTIAWNTVQNSPFGGLALAPTSSNTIGALAA
ncbi:MAG TPA: SGNH/GDSL hydrolase family protein [Ktedonobacteraceae bacterium]|nr:SGNH/GDSL hydrolase family protein [Ktedonobacteraceae bacterium]